MNIVPYISSKIRFSEMAIAGGKMRTPRIRISTIQIVGTLLAFFIGIVSAFLGSTPTDSLILALLVEILALSIDTYYGPLGNSKQLYDAMHFDPILNGYSHCIYEYASIKANIRKNSSNHLSTLLGSWIDERIRAHQAEARDNWSNGHVIIPAQEVEDKSVQVQKSLDKGGFSTQLERYTEFWESTDSYLDITRELAKKGKDFTRVFILQSPESLRNETLKRQIRLDSEFGIRTLVAFTTGPNRITNQDAIRDFGIWDERLLCIVDLSPQTWAVTGATYSIQAAYLERAASWKEHILRHADLAEKYFDS